MCRTPKNLIAQNEFLKKSVALSIMMAQRELKPAKDDVCRTFHGKAVDTFESGYVALPYEADGTAVPVQKFRDAQKRYVAKTDGKAEYVLYGTEAQTRIHFAMPVKNNLYDALEYAGHVEEAARSHRREMERQKNEADGTGKKRPDSGEFLSGFWREDRLIPSVTLTLFWGGCMGRSSESL